MQPESRVIVDVRLTDDEFNSIFGVNDGRQTGNRLSRNIFERNVKKLTLVVRKETFLFWVVNVVIAREVEADILVVNLYIGLGEGRLKSISNALVVSTKDDCIIALHLESQFFVSFMLEIEMPVIKKAVAFARS